MPQTRSGKKKLAAVAGATTETSLSDAGSAKIKHVQETGKSSLHAEQEATTIGEKNSKEIQHVAAAVAGATTETSLGDAGSAKTNHVKETGETSSHAGQEGVAYRIERRQDGFQQDSPAACPSEQVESNKASAQIVDEPIQLTAGLSSLNTRDSSGNVILTPGKIGPLLSILEARTADLKELNDTKKKLNDTKKKLVDTETKLVLTEMKLVDAEKGVKPLREVLDGPLLETECLRGKCTSSNVVYRRQEKGLQNWKSCHQECINFRNSHSAELLDVKVAGVLRTNPEEATQIAFEQSLTGMTTAVLFPAVNGACSTVLGKPVLFFLPVGSGTSGPDFVVQVIDGVAASGGIVASSNVKDLEKRGGGEMKCATNFFKAGTKEPIDIVAEYHKASGNAYIKDCIHQLAGQHCEFNAEFGMMFVWDFLWLTRLLGNGDLMISEPFRSTTAGSNSVMNGFAFFAHCVDTGDISYSAPNLPRFSDTLDPKPKNSDGKENGRRSDKSGGRGPDDDSGGKDHDASGQGKKSGKKAGQGSAFPVQSRSCLPSQLRIFGALQDHDCRVTFKAQMQPSGRDVILKCFAEEKERDAEVLAYKLLEPLDFVPSLVAPPFECTYDSRRKFAMMISYAPGEGCWNLPEDRDKWTHMKECVKLMHEMGVAHGDLSADNMTYDDCRRRIYIFDFGQATIRTNVSHQAFANARRRDFERVATWYKWHHSSAFASSAETVGQVEKKARPRRQRPDVCLRQFR